eukprot:2740182-Karenia_brevis.AAC.1
MMMMMMMMMMMRMMMMITTTLVLMVMMMLMFPPTCTLQSLIIKNNFELGHYARHQQPTKDDCAIALRQAISDHDGGVEA